MVLVSLGEADDLSREGSKKKSALKKNKDGSVVGLAAYSSSRSPISSYSFFFIATLISMWHKFLCMHTTSRYPTIHGYSWSKCKKH